MCLYVYKKERGCVYVSERERERARDNERKEMYVMCDFVILNTKKKWVIKKK